jgi:hypothetical protein
MPLRPLKNEDAEAVNTTPLTVTVAAFSAGTAFDGRKLFGFPVAVHVEYDPPEQEGQGWGVVYAGVQKKPEGHGRHTASAFAVHVLFA